MLLRNSQWRYCDLSPHKLVPEPVANTVMLSLLFLFPLSLPRRGISKPFDQAILWLLVFQESMTVACYQVKYLSSLPLLDIFHFHLDFCSRELKCLCGLDFLCDWVKGCLSQTTLHLLFGELQVDERMHT